LSCQTTFTKKTTSLEYGDYGFLSRADRRELHRTALNVKDRISMISLRKDDILISILAKSHPRVKLPSEDCMTDTKTIFARHSALPL
jgi:hypothetical protein